MSNTGFLLPWTQCNRVPKRAQFFFMFPANAQYTTAGGSRIRCSLSLEVSMSPVPSMDVNVNTTTWYLLNF